MMGVILQAVCVSACLTKLHCLRCQFPCKIYLKSRRGVSERLRGGASLIKELHHVIYLVFRRDFEVWLPTLRGSGQWN
jgi:hypothetical protein